MKTKDRFFSIVKKFFIENIVKIFSTNSDLVSLSKYV